METVTITKENAIKAYGIADGNNKEVLAALLGEKIVIVEVTERVKTLEDAFSEVDPVFKNRYDSEIDEVEKSRIAIEAFAEAMREGKHASECFYYPYFYRSSSGSFSYNDYDYDNDYTNVRAHLA